MKITVGSNAELKDLYTDEAALVELIEKVDHQLTVDPRNMEMRSLSLHYRSELAKTQHYIDTINKEINDEAKP